jgi:hypothetical protein
MELSTIRRVSILFALLVSCGGGDGAGSAQTTTTPRDPAGPFAANGSSGPFAAAVGATNDFTAKYGNSGPFASQGASGPFATPGGIAGDCAAACQRAASFSCVSANANGAQPPQGAAGSSASNGGNNSLDSCLRDCATLDAIPSSCIRNVISSYVSCVAVAPLSCNHNGQVQAEGCPEPDLKPCGVTVMQNQTPVPDQTNTGPALIDGGIR